MAQTLTESQFLKGPSLRLRVEEINRQNLHEYHDNVHDQVFPPSSVQADGVDVRGEKTSASDEELLYRDAARSFGVGKDLHHVC
jgi:hypothetical protein